MLDNIDIQAFLQPIQKDYYKTVAGIAREIVDAALDGEFGIGDDAVGKLEERLWETCDGHECVIYTYKAQIVCLISQNDSYSIENFGTEGIVTDEGIDWSRLAFGALYADVQERLEAVDGFDTSNPGATFERHERWREIQNRASAFTRDQVIEALDEIGEDYDPILHISELRHIYTQKTFDADFEN